MLVVHRSESATALATALADVLGTPLADPFAAEIVAVPAKGVERWIAHRLSGVLGARKGEGDGDGVCANVAFPWPSTVLDEAVQATSPESASAVEQWAPERSVWPLLDVVDEACTSGDPWCAALSQHLGRGEEDKGRRLTVLRKIARLFAEYGSARPAMLRAWAEGRDEQGDGTPLPPDLRWEAELWRRLRERLGTPAPAELLEDACARLRAEPHLSRLPARLSVFGASRLSPARLSVLAALAESRDVHLWVHHASPALWEVVEREPLVLHRRDDTTAHRLNHLLLASMSRDVRELQHQLGRLAPGFTSVHHPPVPPPETLLGRLRRDLATDAAPTAAPLAPGDRSVQLHACHGRTRQVEVLRETILGLLAADPTLEPRDVLVMCPDVETFAPLIAATFALGAEDGVHPAARLRVRLADRALTQTNALLAVLDMLLELGTGRVTASHVLDLAGTPAVRHRFGFDDDEVERLRDWVASAAIRWGLDRDHRGNWQLEGLGQGTWRAGLDRLLLGVALPGTPEAGVSGDVVPLDDVDSADIDLAGRLAELVDRLDAAVDLMGGRHDVATWLAGLETAVLSLAAPGRDDQWQVVQLRSELADLAEAGAGSTAQLALPDVRSLLADVLAGRPTRASFRTGTLTVCTLVPMRSVPHRVVCLLGMDDGVFPRQTTRDGDDVLTRDPWVGERDPRSEDRQLFLDAISAAEEHLVITYTGADERTGAPVPPAVPLEELMDALDRTASVEQGRVRDAITIRHPLQPFDARNFTDGALRGDGPFSFDPVGYAAAEAAAGPRTDPPAFLPAPLGSLPAGDVDLADLLKLLEHPARGFLRQRLQVAATREDPEPADALPVELDSLELWAVGERVLRYRLAGMEPQACLDVELRRGDLPPGPLGETCLRNVGREVEAVVAASAAERAYDPESVDVDVALPDGTRVSGTVAGVRRDTLLSLTYSKLGPKHRLKAWVQLLALTAAHPDRPWRAVTAGRGSRGGASRSCLGPLAAADALAALGELVEVYRAGLRAPLPLPVKTGAEYAFLRSRGRPPSAARVGAERKWLSARYAGENDDAEHALVYGRRAPMSVLTDQRPAPGEGGAGWPPDETDRFGLLARRVWQRLLDAESVQ